MNGQGSYCNMVMWGDWGGGGGGGGSGRLMEEGRGKWRRVEKGREKRVSP